MLDYLNSLRREPDMSTNANSINENTLQMIMNSHREKEQKWMREKRKLKTKVTSLEKELVAIRAYLKSTPHGNSESPIPAFVRAS